MAVMTERNDTLNVLGENIIKRSLLEKTPAELASPIITRSIIFGLCVVTISLLSLPCVFLSENPLKACVSLLLSSYGENNTKRSTATYIL